VIAKEERFTGGKDSGKLLPFFFRSFAREEILIFLKFQITTELGALAQDSFQFALCALWNVYADTLRNQLIKFFK